MTLFILHYHLRPGGVTTVIRNAVRALESRHTIRLLTDFGYSDRPAPSRAAFLRDARTLRDKIGALVIGQQALDTRHSPSSLARSGPLLHTHNPGLGKHPRLTAAIRLLAETGKVRILNQVHDFPEDNRPGPLHALRWCTGRRDDDFYRWLCYYDLPNVRRAALTTHDAARLAGHGIPANNIDILPNPVDTASWQQVATSASEWTPHRQRVPPPAETLARIASYAAAHGYRFDPHKKILLSPMKVMVRKNNAEAVDLIRHLPGYQLLISLDAASPRDRAYSDQLKARIRRDRLPVVIGCGSLFDSPLPLFQVAHAILTTSQQEGFGYTFLEGWLAGKLVAGRDLPEVTQDFKAAGLRLDHLYPEPDPAALRRLLARPSPVLIAHNRRVVRRHYSLAAYARRFEKIVARF